MESRMQVVSALYLVASIIAMCAVWAYWTPTGNIQPYLWWAVMILLGLSALGSVSGIILAGGQKKFREESRKRREEFRRRHGVRS